MKTPTLFRSIILAGSLLLQSGGLCIRSHAAAGDIDLSFDPGSGVNGPVNVIAVQSNGKAIIGGQFTTVKGLARSRIARLNADGSGDASFDSGAVTNFFSVSALSLQSDGKVLVGHDAGISRLNSDGSPDTSFAANVSSVCDTEGCYLSVNSITVQPDGKVLIAGVFSTGTGTNYLQGLAQLNSDGSLDTTFKPSATRFWTYPLSLQPDGKLIVGGYFVTNICDAHGCYEDYRYFLARLDANGNRDATFDPTALSNGWAQAIALQPDGKALIGGVFTSNGTNRTGVARFHSNGTLDNSFYSSTSPDLIHSVALQTDGRVLIGGSFSTVNGSARNKLARLNSDGSLDHSFNPGAGLGSYDSLPVNSVALQSDGRVLIGGNFTSANATNHDYFERFNADGSKDGSFDPGRELNGGASLALQPDGKVLIGGVFTFINGTNHYASARLNANGSRDSTFVSNNFNPDLNTHYATNCPPGYDCPEWPIPIAVAVQPDGKVLVGGFALYYECNPFDGGCVVFEIPFLHRVNANGGRDAGFNHNIGLLGPPGIRALAVQPDGKVLVAGQFLTVAGVSRKGIARLNTDGSLDGSFDPGEGAFGISSIALQGDGKVLIGGFFSTVNGALRQGIARLHANGSVDASFNSVTNAYEVFAVTLQPDGKVLIGGGFTTLNGTNRNHIARLNADGSLDSSFDPGLGPDQRIRSIALAPDGNVLIGGDFITVNGEARPHVARLYGDSRKPSLNLTLTNGIATLKWPLTALNFQLQESTNLALPNAWSPVTESHVTNGVQISVTVPTIAAQKFFRLQSQ